MTRGDLSLESGRPDGRREARQVFIAQVPSLFGVVRDAAGLITLDGAVGASLLEEDPKAINDV